MSKNFLFSVSGFEFVCFLFCFGKHVFPILSRPIPGVFTFPCVDYQSPPSWISPASHYWPRLCAHRLLFPVVLAFCQTDVCSVGNKAFLSVCTLAPAKISHNTIRVGAPPLSLSTLLSSHLHVMKWGIIRLSVFCLCTVRRVFAAIQCAVRDTETWVTARV